MRFIIYTLKIVAALVLLVFAALGIYSLTAATPQVEHAVQSAAKSQTWTCSMHPQIRRDAPGTCPICGMPLIPIGSNVDADAGDAMPMLTLSEHALEMADVATVPVERRELVQEIRAVGKVQHNEAGLATVVTRVDGYIERLYVDYTGITVKKGDHLVDIYSQDLTVALHEMLISRTYSAGSSGSLSVDNSRAKLRQFGVNDEQIDQVLKTGKVLPYLTLYAPISGTIVEKMIFEGSHVDRGAILYRLANLESVWLLLDIYEYEINWIQPGQQVEFEAEAFPGQKFKGTVNFISPTLNEDTRTIQVRVNVDNRDGRLKPGMYASSIIKVKLLADGKPGPTGLEGKYTCPMHPEVIEEVPGKCPICGMSLGQIHGIPKPASEVAYKVLAIPASAVLDSGTRKLVYVEKARGQFVPAEVLLGPRTGEFYPVIRGVNEGDRVATRGNFLIDSQFQINGLPSLFYKEGSASATGHQHGGSAQSPSTPSFQGSPLPTTFKGGK